MNFQNSRTYPGIQSPSPAQSVGTKLMVSMIFKDKNHLIEKSDNDIKAARRERAPTRRHATASQRSPVPVQYDTRMHWWVMDARSASYSGIDSLFLRDTNNFGLLTQKWVEMNVSSPNKIMHIVIVSSLASQRGLSWYRQFFRSAKRRLGKATHNLDSWCSFPFWQSNSKNI